MAADFGIGAAANVAAADVASPIISLVIGIMKDIIGMGKNVSHLNTDFTRMQDFVVHIDNHFRQQQIELPQPVQNRLERIRNDLQEVKDLIDNSEPQPRCLGCCSFRNPMLSTQIRDWKMGFDRLFEELRTDFSICANMQLVASTAGPREEIFRQPVPESGFVGSAIEDAQKKVQEWLGEAHRQARMVGVWGMGGVGKTSILKLIYNHFKEVRGIFDAVIWLTISQKYEITNLQASMAETLNLKLEGTSDKDRRKMKLSASLRGKKFLLILDDLWRSIDLTEIGVTFEDGDNCSKILMSSRSSDVIAEMGAIDNYSLRIQPLSTEEGLVLFRREAFGNGVVPNESIQDIAGEIAMECQGLPLALVVVAAAMRSKKTEEEWKRALDLMRKVDPSFRIRHSSIDAELYTRLKWSYDELADPNLKICFLYCAVFPEDAEIDVETLVQMWSAEKLVTDMDAGHEYINALVGKCLFEYVSDPILYNFRGVRKPVKVHDIVHDLAISIGRSEENCLFASGQHLQNFPIESEIRDCKRISVGHNDIRVLPTSLACPKLVSLVLANNKEITEVKEGFLSAAMSLKVLDLSRTNITTLPTSLGQLEQLEFLDLSDCSSLQTLPESIGSLSRLKFLFLRRWNDGCAINVEDIANLSNLMVLKAAVKSEIKESTMTTWTELRRLEVWCVYDADRDDVGEEHIFPFNMDNLNKLEHFSLQRYKGVSLPNCIPQFQNLRELELWNCEQLRELPGIVGGWGFPMLKRLRLHTLSKLESMMVGSSVSVLSSEETMPQLEYIEITNCSSLKRLRTRKLPRLRKLSIKHCTEFEALEIESCGLPMLEDLTLWWLEKCETIVGPSGVINDGVMPKLQLLRIFECPSLRRLVLEKLSNLRDIDIFHCNELRELAVGSGGFPALETLTLHDCPKVENMVGPHDAWDDQTMPQLRSLQIFGCPLLKTLPRGMEKLSRLQQIMGGLELLQIIGEDENVKNSLLPLFTY